MLEIKLFISTHVFYKDLFLYPPPGIKWRGTYKVEDFEALKLYNRSGVLKRNMVKYFYRFLNVPRIAFLTDVKGCNLIYSTRGISILNRLPWIVDFEHVSHFVGLDREKIQNKNFQNKIKKYLNSTYCKKILPNTNAAKNSFINIFGDSYLNKTEIFYQTMKPTNLLRRRADDKIKILFNGNFYHKSGDLVLDIFKTLNDHYHNLELIMVSNPPNEIINNIKKEYKNIYFYTKGPNITRSQLINDFYMKSDIFLYPSQGDAYFNPILLALNAGLPIICSDYYAFPEIVKNNENGYLIHSVLGDIEKNFPKQKINYKEQEDKKIIGKNKKEFIREAIDRICLLIENKSLRITLGNNSRSILENGRYSIDKRDAQLLQIIKESV